MADINDYANDLLLKFMDEVHELTKGVLMAEFGESWLEVGVRIHLSEAYFNKAKEMLDSPLRVVDMGKQDEDLYGIEHVWNIINGNRDHFRQFFGNRGADFNRAQNCLSQITEVRHNLAHRRRNHLLRRVNLITFVNNCQMILTAFNSELSKEFEGIADLLSNGAVPWGEALGGWLPPSDEIYDEFIGRADELAGLSEWLASDSRQVSIHGYGGVGKSALAYRFAREVRDSSSDKFIAVCWVSAKTQEFVDGTSQPKRADFTDLNSLIRAIWSAMYDEALENITKEDVIAELKEMPILLVVDDFNTVLGNIEIYDFLRMDLRQTETRTIFTSRDDVQGVQNLKVPPFNDEELKEFVEQKCHEFGIERAHQDLISRNINRIKAVTEGYPLFVNDLIRYGATVGIVKAVDEWELHKGDAAREYALRNQIGSTEAVEILIALAVSNKALISYDIAKIAGLTIEDTEDELESLQKSKLVNRVWDDQSSSPAFRMNANTTRLVQRTYQSERKRQWDGISARFKNLTGESVSVTRQRRVEELKKESRKLADQSMEEAAKFLEENMTGELVDSPELHSVLAGYFSRLPGESQQIKARQSFRRSHDLGAKNIETYYYWAQLEERIPESITHDKGRTAVQWNECRKVCELGIERSGASRPLCYKAGSAALEEGRSWYFANQFTESDTAYDAAVEWYKKALAAPNHEHFGVSSGRVYSGLIKAYEETTKFDLLAETLDNWHASSVDKYPAQKEYIRLRRQYQEARESSKFQQLAYKLNPQPN